MGTAFLGVPISSIFLSPTPLLAAPLDTSQSLNPFSSTELNPHLDIEPGQSSCFLDAMDAVTQLM